MAHKKSIQSNWKPLIDHIVCTPIIDRLYTKKNLTEHELEQFDACETRDKKARVLLSIIKRKPTHVFEEFNIILSETQPQLCEPALLYQYEAYKSLIRRHWQDLVSDLDISAITDHLYTNDIISQRDMENIQARLTRQDKARQLLTTVHSKPPEKIEGFLQGLKKIQPTLHLRLYPKSEDPPSGFADGREIEPTVENKNSRGSSAISDTELEQYVSFEREGEPHVYNYPNTAVSLNLMDRLCLPKCSCLQTSTENRTDSAMTNQGNPLISQRARCVNCHETFVISENWRGSCEDAPDKVLGCIERVSCVRCAHGLVYLCMADAEGDYGHTCVCDRSDRRNCQKWTALTILSLFVPCLWCYWPLMACHRCGVSCGCCGERHKAE